MLLVNFTSVALERVPGLVQCAMALSHLSRIVSSFFPHCCHWCGDLGCRQRLRFLSISDLGSKPLVVAAALPASLSGQSFLVTVVCSGHNPDSHLSDAT